MELRNDRVLIERLPEREGLIIKPDIANSKGIEGIVRAVGPGKWIEGGWWYTKIGHMDGDTHIYGELIGAPTVDLYSWLWYDGYRQEPEVKVGQRVLFNSKWNDFAKDFYDDLPLGVDAKLHLVQESDIFGILS